MIIIKERRQRHTLPLCTDHCHLEVTLCPAAQQTRVVSCTLIRLPRWLTRETRLMPPGNRRETCESLDCAYIGADFWCITVLWRMTLDLWVCYSSRHDTVILFWFVCLLWIPLHVYTSWYVCMCPVKMIPNCKGGTLRFSPLFLFNNSRA